MTWIRTLCVILLFSVVGMAQDDPAIKVPPVKKVQLWQWDDGLLIGSLALDEISTYKVLHNCAGCRETGVIKNPAARIGVKAGIASLIKFYEYKHPEQRPKTKWFKLAIAGLYIGVAAHNFSQK